MALVAIYDANVLYGNTLRDLLIRIAGTDGVQAEWTEAILDETFRSLTARRPDIPVGKLRRLRELMNLSVKDCLVEGYEPLIDNLALPDPGDESYRRKSVDNAVRCSLLPFDDPGRLWSWDGWFWASVGRRSLLAPGRDRQV